MTKMELQSGASAMYHAVRLVDELGVKIRQSLVAPLE